MMAERNREVGDIDVMSHDWSGLAEMDVKGLYMNMDGILPDAADKFSSVNGINSNGYAYAYWGNQTGIAYDPAKVDEANLPQTPADFAAFWVANPNMFGFNYENGGSGPSFYENTLRNLSDADFTSGTSSPEKIAKLDAGIKFFNDHASHYIITASNTDSLTRLSDGELSMVAAWEDHLAGLQRKGEVRKDLKFYIPKMGMNGGGNNVSIPKNAKNKAAALVFINWLTSADVQTGFNKQFGSAPMNRKADDSAALVRADQRENRVGEAINPFRADMEEYFIEKVILAR
ncbi:Possible ABC transporter, periplasmic substrate X binding protein precursor [hydrothermal vent metagenome]|uniref:Possible ABC transporter, periplasmic substrate X binding protein n=1 Tax=hydrothermal vent metagenome TaxID=652676 RepID=A0A3B0TSY2_9ZZZZ